MSITLKNDAGTFSTNLSQSNPTANVNIALPTTSGTMATLESPAFTGTPTAPTATAGTNTTQVATTAFAMGAGVGSNQTWQDVKASRAVNTTYTNTTGKPKAVSIRMFVTVASTNINLNVSGVTVQQLSSTIWMANSYVSVFAIVPAGGTYDLTIVTGGVTIQTWGELI